MPKNSKENRRSKKRIKAVFLFLFIFLGWAGYTSFNQWQVIQQKKDHLEQLKGEQDTVQQDKQKLEKQILLLQKDEYIAEIARKYYFLSKPGEFIFISPNQ